MNRLKKATAVGALAVTAAIGAPVLAPADTGLVQAAEAVPYKLARGTWGAQYHFVDRFHSCVNNMERRYREDYRKWWDGKRWVNKIYYRGVYHSTDARGFAKYCGRV